MFCTDAWGKVALNGETLKLVSVCGSEVNWFVGKRAVWGNEGLPHSRQQTQGLVDQWSLPSCGLFRLRRRKGGCGRDDTLFGYYKHDACDGVIMYWQCDLFRIEPETDFARLDSVRPSCSSRDGVPLIKEGSTLPLKPSFQLLFAYRCFFDWDTTDEGTLVPKAWIFKNKCQKSYWHDFWHLLRFTNAGG